MGRKEDLGASSLREDRAATPSGPSPQAVSGIAGIPLRRHLLGKVMGGSMVAGAALLVMACWGMKDGTGGG